MNVDMIECVVMNECVDMNEYVDMKPGEINMSYDRFTHS